MAQRKRAAAAVSGVPGGVLGGVSPAHHAAAVFELGISRGARRALAALQLAVAVPAEFPRRARRPGRSRRSASCAFSSARRTSFSTSLPAVDDDFQWLALMQHYGAPTRLLDFTWSPYVAAFFALERTLGDGVVWAMNPARIDSGRAPKPARMDPRMPGQFPAVLPEGQPPLHLDGRAAHDEPAADRAIGHVRRSGRAGHADRRDPEATPTRRTSWRSS